jgi:hypothetical protein
MGQLERDRDVGPASNAVERPADGGFSLVVPQPDIRPGDAALRKNRGGFDRQQRRSRERKMAEVDQMPVGHASVLSGVLAHGRDHDPVAQIKIADAERLEEGGLRHDDRSLRGAEKRATSGV